MTEQTTFHLLPRWCEHCCIFYKMDGGLFTQVDDILSYFEYCQKPLNLERLFGSFDEL